MYAQYPRRQDPWSVASYHPAALPALGTIPNDSGIAFPAQSRTNIQDIFNAIGGNVTYVEIILIVQSSRDERASFILHQHAVVAPQECRPQAISIVLSPLWSGPRKIRYRHPFPGLWEQYLEPSHVTCFASVAKQRYQPDDCG